MSLLVPMTFRSPRKGVAATVAADFGTSLRGIDVRAISCADAVPGERQCVGYDKPRYLGGKDTVDNLVLCHFEVYWAIGAQLLAGVRGRPVGTRVSGVSVRP